MTTERTRYAKGTPLATECGRLRCVCGYDITPGAQWCIVCGRSAQLATRERICESYARRLQLPGAEGKRE